MKLLTDKELQDEMKLICVDDLDQETKYQLIIHGPAFQIKIAERVMDDNRDTLEKLAD